MPVSEYNFIELQPKYELLPKFGKQRKTMYVADFALWNDGELLEVIDVKGMPTEAAPPFRSLRFLSLSSSFY